MTSAAQIEVTSPRGLNRQPAIYPGGKVFKTRAYPCKCGHLNLVGRFEYLSSTKVVIAPSWRGKCGACGADLRWQERKRW